jgi:hypothetical protein
MSMATNSSPKTAEELKIAIESIFTVIGHSNKAIEFVGDQIIRHNTYHSSVEAPRAQEGQLDLDNAYWPTEELAVQQLWKNICQVKDGTYKLTEEAKQDGFIPVPSTMIYWRSFPQVDKLPTGIYRARLRASFL